MTGKDSLICKKCGLVFEKELALTEKLPLGNGSFHLKASCPECHAFVKFLSHTSVKVLWFGKYRGKTIAQIAKDDPGYLEWLLSKGVKSARVKSVIEGALCKTSR